MSLRGLIRGLVFLVSLVVIGFLIQAMQLDGFLNKSWVDSSIRDHGLRGKILFITIGGVFVAVGLPRQVISFLAGYGLG